MKRFLFVITAFLATASGLFAEKLVPITQSGAGGSYNVSFGADGKNPVPWVLRVTPGLSNPASWTVAEQAPGKPEKNIACATATVFGKSPDSPAFASSVALTFAAKLDRKNRYVVRPAAGVLKLKAGYTFGSDEIIITPQVIDNVNYEELFQSNRVLQKKAELKRGDKSTAFSGRVWYRSPEFMKVEGLALEAEAKADIDLSNAAKGDYFDTIEGSLGVAYHKKWTVNSSFKGVLDFGMQSTIETDRDFDNTNYTGGVFLRSYIVNPLTTGLSRVFIRDLEKEEAVLAPRVKISYNVVGEINRTLPSTAGDQRLTFEAYWNLPLARGFAVPLIEGTYNADLLFDIELIHDIEEGTTNDASKIALEFSPADNPKGPAFTVSYEQGRMKPKFERVDGIFAGFKLPF